jgi:hypothetical protein
MIKLVDLLKEITEAKQVGNLYHFTPLSNLKKILENRVLFTNEDNQVSTTRHADMNLEPLYGSNKRGMLNNLARIMLDGDKISTKYKIRPFSYSSLGKELNLGEEQIVVNGDRFPFIPYLKRIDIFIDKKDKVNPKILELLDKANIPYEIYQGTPASNIPYNQPKDGNPNDIDINKIPEKRIYTEEELYFPGMKPAKDIKYYKNDFALQRDIPDNDLFTSPEYPGYYIQKGFKEWESAGVYDEYYNINKEKINIKIIPIPMYNDPKWRKLWKQTEELGSFQEGNIYDSYILIPKNEVV